MPQDALTRTLAAIQATLTHDSTEAINSASALVNDFTDEQTIPYLFGCIALLLDNRFIAADPTSQELHTVGRDVATSISAWFDVEAQPEMIIGVLLVVYGDPDIASSIPRNIFILLLCQIIAALLEDYEDIPGSLTVLDEHVRSVVAK
jgi:hypothetical protein